MSRADKYPGTEASAEGGRFGLKRLGKPSHPGEREAHARHSRRGRMWLGEGRVVRDESEQNLVVRNKQDTYRQSLRPRGDNRSCPHTLPP